MNDSPLLTKMDALLKKHRGGEAVAPAPAVVSGPPPGAWLPVLTDVIERGTPDRMDATGTGRPGPSRDPAA